MVAVRRRLGGLRTLVPRVTSFAGALASRMLPSSTPMTYDDFHATKYFAALDGLRAVSILFVIVSHVNDRIWGWGSGVHGVSIFFVISGFLITTLCLREEEQQGSFSLPAFYIRRTLRIFPLYYVMLSVYVFLYMGLNFRHHAALLKSALPYYLTYFNDFKPFHPHTPYGQSWSLGVEEKFYLIWPAVAFIAWKSRRSLRVYGAVAAILVPFLFWHFKVFYFTFYYSEIMVGCLLALALQNRVAFERLRFLGRRGWLLIGLAALIAAQGYVRPYRDWKETLYPIAAGVFMMGLLIGKAPWGTLLESRVMVYIGTRAYGIYLVHLACLDLLVTAMWRVFPSLSFDASNRPVGSHELLVSLMVLILGTGVSVAFADVLNRAVEGRFISLGRRLSRRIAGTTPLSPVRMPTDEMPPETPSASSVRGPQST